MRFLSLFIFLLLPSLSYGGFSISNMVMDLTPSGKGSSGSLLVRNEGTNEISVALFMKKRSHDEMGHEIRSEFDVKKDFLVMPATFKIKPKGVVSVRIVYVGDKNITSEKAYRMIVANVDPQPYSSSTKDGVTAKVDALVSYGVALYVSPENAKPNLKIHKSSEEKGKVGFVIENLGNKRAAFREKKIEISSPKLPNPETYSFTAFEVMGSPLLPGEKRFAPIPKDSKATLGATLTVEEK